MYTWDISYFIFQGWFANSERGRTWADLRTISMDLEAILAAEAILHVYCILEITAIYFPRLDCELCTRLDLSYRGPSLWTSKPRWLRRLYNRKRLYIMYTWNKSFIFSRLVWELCTRLDLSYRGPSLRTSRLWWPQRPCRLQRPPRTIPLPTGPASHYSVSELLSRC